MAILNTRPAVAVLSNTAWSIWNFRRGLIAALLREGYRVVALAPRDGYETRIEGLGARFIGLSQLHPQGRKIGQDMRLIRELRTIYSKENIGWVISFTIKPNTFGGLAAMGSSTVTLPTVNGLGYVFQKKGLLGRIAGLLYRLAFRRAKAVFFQNVDDRAFFLQNRLVEAGKCRLVAGSGVDLQQFFPTPGKSFVRTPVFLFAARLVAEKGIHEFLAAAGQVKTTVPEAQFLLAGMTADNPNALSFNDLELHIQQERVRLVPPTDDMSALLDTVDCVVLPSYYGEGVPRVLLEALAKGLPVITTDWPGCRDTVDAGENGWLVPPRDAGALATAMLEFCKMSPQLRAAMGRAGREKAVQVFDEQLVIQHYLDTIKA